METPAAGVSPALEADAQLGGGVRRTHHLHVGHAEPGIEAPDRGDRRLAHADRADRARFDQRDRQIAALEMLRQRRRRHPPRGAPADDDEAPDAVWGSHVHASCRSYHPPIDSKNLAGGTIPPARQWETIRT